MASNGRPGIPSPEDQTNNVSVRVIALAHATNENEDIYLVLNLDTTVTQLKERLQQSLSEHPRPETQRLIYQGRPLIEGNTTLRNILRLDPGNANNPPVHVLHLVVRGDQSTIPNSTNRPQSVQPQPQPEPQPLNQPPPNNANAASVNIQHPATAFHLAQQTFPQGHPAHALFQNAMQQHMALHNQHLNQNFPGIHQHPFPPSIHNIPQIPGVRAGAAQPAQTGLQPGIGSNPMFTSTQPRARTPDANEATPNASSNVTQSSMSVRIQETVGPNGERVRRVVHNGPMLNAHMNPVERSASAPGTGGRSAVSGTAAQPGATSVAVPPLLQQLHPSQTHLPTQANFQQPFVRLPSLQVPTFQPNAPIPSRNPLVYLLSSPNGPEALLFTPNHGIFSSSQQALPMTQTVSQNATQATESPGQTQQPTPTQPPQPTRATPRNNDQGQVALRPQAPALGQAQAQAQPGRREGEDLIALVLQRGWLFLRLYMFIFVLSEPGTWRRYLLLTVASLVCLLPRNNPFTDMFQAARRHFDNLIGPPQPAGRPQRQQANDQQAGRNLTNNNADSNSSSNSRALSQQNSSGAQMPTNEEHARRILQEHEQRNPNFVRETIYRIEQAVALFLASLIPGVGERHVRAREEARRIAQELEERRRREDQERAQQQISESKSDSPATSQSTPSSSGSSTTAAMSTGADAATASQTPASSNDQGLRMRSAGPSSQASSS